MCEICESAERLHERGPYKAKNTSDITRVLIHMRELRREVRHYRRIYGTDRVSLEYLHGIQSMQILCKE